MYEADLRAQLKERSPRGQREAAGDRLRLQEQASSCSLSVVNAS